MKDMYEATRRVVEKFRELGVNHMIVGGISSNAYGIPRATKDGCDVRNIIAVQGDAALDWDYIHHWCAIHGTRALLDEIRASIPPID
jgi:hypothetical protein